MNIHKATAIINYSLNKFCPIGLIAFLSFHKMGLNTWEPYAVCALCFFSQHFHFKVGYSVAICEEKGLLDD